MVREFAVGEIMKSECTNCHQHYEVEDEYIGQEVECTQCGATFVVNALRVANKIAPFGRTKAKTYCAQCGAPNADGSVFCAKCGAKLQGSDVSICGSNKTKSDGEYPVLDNWKESKGMCVLGVTCVIALNVVYEMLGDNIGVIATLFSLAYIVLMYIYALSIYPSYFTPKPKLTGNGKISFLNIFLGGIIWGLFFQNNIAKRKKGISNIVFVVLLSIYLICTLAGFTEGVNEVGY